MCPTTHEPDPSESETISIDFPRQVSALDLPLRVRNILREEGINRTTDLLDKRRSELFRLPGMGVTSIQQIQDALSPYGVQLRP